MTKRPYRHSAVAATCDAILARKGSVKCGDHVPDVAVGAGDQTLDVAQRVGFQGFVLAHSLDAKKAEAGWVEMELALARYETPNGRIRPNESLLASARKPQTEATIPAV